MTSKQIKKAFDTIKKEHQDRNVKEIYVDLENVSIRCTQIGRYVSNGILWEDLLQVMWDDETISIIKAEHIKNIRWTNTNNETFKIIKEN